MAFKHGKATKVLFDQYDISAYLTGSVVSADIDNPKTTTYGATGVTRSVVGLKDGSVTADFLHDAAAGGSHAVLSGAYGAASAGVFTRGCEGFALGAPAELLSIREKNYSPNSPVDGLVEGSVTFEGDGGVDLGKSLKDLTATTATADGASIDNAAATSNGGVGHIHATVVSGTTPTLDAKIQHSVDDAVWADLITFTQLTAAGKQRVEVAAGTTVRRYLRETHTVAGTTPSFTYAVAFARR